MNHQHIQPRGPSLPPGVVGHPSSYGGRETSAYGGPRAVLVTRNPGINGTEEDGILAYLRVNNGEIPLYVSHDPNHRGGDSDLIIVDLKSFPLDTPELEAIVSKSGPVVGIGKKAVAHFPGHHQLNGYGGVGFDYLLRILQEANKPNA